MIKIPLSHYIILRRLKKDLMPDMSETLAHPYSFIVYTHEASFRISFHVNDFLPVLFLWGGFNNKHKKEFIYKPLMWVTVKSSNFERK